MISVNFKKRFYTSISLFFLIILIASSNFFLVYSLIILGTLSIIEFITITKKISPNKLFLIPFNLFFIFYIFIFCFLFLFFSNFIQLKLFIFILLISCAASDIGGFIFGKTFKGPKLTKISPNKTFSGVFGSIFLTILTMMIAFFLISQKINFLIIIIAVITSIACQIGDLFFSFLKRRARMKDTSNFLPGHGGILDRIDGILIGIPVGFISLILFF